MKVVLQDDARMRCKDLARGLTARLKQAESPSVTFPPKKSFKQIDK
jgi:hypothetical protein